MGKGKFSVIRLFLVLLVIACIGVAIWIGYILFFSHGVSPLIGSIILIVDIAILIWDIYVLRNRNYTNKNPKFVIVLIPLIVIFLILTFAGVKPLSEYKDTAITSISGIFKSDTADEIDHSPSEILNEPEITPAIEIPAIPNKPSPPPNTEPNPDSSTETSPTTIPSLILTDIVMDVTPEDIQRSLVHSCKVTVYLKESASTAPGYYNIELFSQWQNYGSQEFKYLKGCEVKPLTWQVSGGETWLAMGRGVMLRDIFNITIS